MTTKDRFIGAATRFRDFWNPPPTEDERTARVRWDALVGFTRWLRDETSLDIPLTDTALENWVRAYLATPDIEFAPGEPTPDLATIVGERIRYDQGYLAGREREGRLFGELATLVNRTEEAVADLQDWVQAARDHTDADMRRAQRAVQQAQAFLDTPEELARARRVPDYPAEVMEGE